MIKLSVILNEERFSYLEILNNKVNLDRNISTVESTETPDVYNYIPSNTFLVTTGMIYENNQKQLISLIESLDKLGISALAIKLDRFLKEIDEEVIEKCDSLGFPLLLIPERLTLGDVFLDVLSYIWDNKNDELAYSFNVQKKFYNLALKDSSVKVLIKSLSNTLDKQVALVDPFGNINSMTGKIDKTYSKSSIRNLIEKIIIDRRSSKLINTKILNFNNENINITIHPINISHYYPYYLIIFNSETLVFPTSKMIIEQASLVISFTLYKDLRSSYDTIVDREDFVKDLLYLDTFKDLTNPQIVSIGQKYGLIIEERYKVILMNIEDKIKFSSNFDYRDELYTLIYKWLNKKLNKDTSNVIIFPDLKSYQFIIILQGEEKRLKQLLKNYRAILQKTLKIDTMFAIGEDTSQLEELKYSYIEAKKSILNGQTKDNISFIKYYTPLEAQDLFRFIPKEQSEIFIKNTLKKLSNPQDQSQRDLLETLKTYLSFNSNITKTSEKLFIHRNTVIYRIEKCEEILNTSIDDPKFNFDLRLSLNLIK